MIESQSFENDDFRDITRFIDYYMDSKDEIYINAKIVINPSKRIKVENNSVKIILKDSNKVEYSIKNANIKQLHVNKKTLYYCGGRNINTIILDKNISIIESKIPFFE